MRKFTENDIMDLYWRRDCHTWELIYIDEGEVRATYRRARTLPEAVKWLADLGIHDIVDVGLMDEGTWRRND